MNISRMYKAEDDCVLPGGLLDNGHFVDVKMRIRKPEDVFVNAEARPKACHSICEKPQPRP